VWLAFECNIVQLYELTNLEHIYSVSQKNDTDVAHYSFDADQP